MIPASSCQRWRDRRAQYRPAGEIFDPSRAHVDAIDEASAKAFVVRHHYSGSYPAARFRAGLFWRPSTFAAEILAGVAVFSVPMNQQTIPHYFDGLEPNAGVELGRLVLLDEVPANAESWFVARAFRLVRSSLAIAGVLSYSDPVDRIAADGQVVKPGHVGTVYQALNACYRGRSSSRCLLLAADGRSVSHRALSKLRQDDQGAAYAYEQLRALGAPERQPLEEGPAYVARALAEGRFRRFRHPGNHAYTWRLDSRPGPGSLLRNTLRRQNAAQLRGPLRRDARREAAARQKLDRALDHHIRREAESILVILPGRPRADPPAAQRLQPRTRGETGMTTKLDKPIARELALEHEGRKILLEILPGDPAKGELELFRFRLKGTSASKNVRTVTIRQVLEAAGWQIKLKIPKKAAVAGTVQTPLGVVDLDQLVQDLDATNKQETA